MQVTLDHLGEDVTDRSEAVRTRDAYLRLLEALAPLQLGRAAEVSMKLSSCGQGLPIGGPHFPEETRRPGGTAPPAARTTGSLALGHPTSEQHNPELQSPP